MSNDDYEDTESHYTRRDAERNHMLASILKFYILVGVVLLVGLLLLSSIA